MQQGGLGTLIPLDLEHETSTRNQHHDMMRRGMLGGKGSKIIGPRI